MFSVKKNFHKKIHWAMAPFNGGKYFCTNI